MNKNFGPLIEVLEHDDEDGLEFYSQDSAMDQLQRFMEQHHMEYCHEYGEPGYSLTGDQKVVVFGDYWCRCKQNPHAGQPKHTYHGEEQRYVKPEDLHSYDAHFPRLWKRFEEIAAFEWHDEWYVDYEADKAYRTSGDSYMWQPSVIFTEYGDALTPDTDLEEWVEWATSEPTERIIPRTIADKSKLEDIGFREYNGVFENGWHPGQTDDPAKIVEQIENDPEMDGAEVLFWLTETSQFYIRFEALVRVAERHTLSSNAFSVDLQLADVVSYIGNEMPDVMDRLLKVYPELPRALETLTGTSSWIDTEAARVDVEFSSWVIDWIEQNTPIMWEEGEPFVTVKPWEDDSDD